MIVHNRLRDNAKRDLDGVPTGQRCLKMVGVLGVQVFTCSDDPPQSARKTLEHIDRMRS